MVEPWGGLKFLDRAEASSARFVSDMQGGFVAEEGQPLECRTRLVPEGTAKDVQRGMRTAEAGSKSPGLTLVRRPVVRIGGREAMVRVRAGAEGPRRAADRGRPSSAPGRWTGR